jgi:predicted PurR-regulated permease PerM
MADRGRKILEWDQLTETYAELAIRLGLLGLLLYLSIVLIRPFVSIIIWSAVLTIALYPVFTWITDRLGGRKRLAAAIVTVLGLLVVIGPATWLVLSVIDTVRVLVDRLDTPGLTFPQPWDPIRGWPLVGEQLFQFWDLAATNAKAAIAKVTPYLKPLGNVLLGIAAGAGVGTLKFLAAVIIAGFLFVPGPMLARATQSMVERVAPNNGEQFVTLAGATIRTVAQGVIGIAALQALLAGLGLMAAGVPGASLLTTGVLILGIIQIGPTIILLPLIVWSWFTMDTAPAVIFSVYMACVSALDNVLKPLIMRRGLKTPMVVILIGLLGGTISYGITGLFLGPIVLAVIWELAVAWIERSKMEAQQAGLEEVDKAPMAISLDASELKNPEQPPALPVGLTSPPTDTRPKRQ